MQVLLNEEGYVTSYNMADGAVLDDGIEISEPENFSDFEVNFFSYKIQNGELVLDEEQQGKRELQARRDEIRKLREEICFPVVDRSKLWYDRLTEEQYAELSAWYQAWLQAPGNLKIPETPDWV